MLNPIKPSPTVASESTVRRLQDDITVAQTVLDFEQIFREYTNRLATMPVNIRDRILVDVRTVFADQLTLLASSTMKVPTRNGFVEIPTSTQAIPPAPPPVPFIDINRQQKLQVALNNMTPAFRTLMAHMSAEWPSSPSDLMKSSGFSHTTVEKALKLFVRDGFVKKVAKGLYLLSFEKEVTVDTTMTKTSPAPITPSTISLGAFILNLFTQDRDELSLKDMAGMLGESQEETREIVNQLVAMRQIIEIQPDWFVKTGFKKNGAPKKIESTKEFDSRTDW